MCVQPMVMLLGSGNHEPVYIFSWMTSVGLISIQDDVNLSHLFLRQWTELHPSGILLDLFYSTKAGDRNGLRAACPIPGESALSYRPACAGDDIQDGIAHQHSFRIWIAIFKVLHPTRTF